MDAILLISFKCLLKCDRASQLTTHGQVQAITGVGRRGRKERVVEEGRKEEGRKSGKEGRREEGGWLSSQSTTHDQV